MPVLSQPVDVSVVIVSYNTRDLLRACIQSVYAERGSLALQIMVVDNASADGSADMVRREFPDVHLIANRDNVGFARANNQAFAEARGGFLLLLNPDAEIRDDAVGRALRFAREHPDVGMLGCKVLFPNGEQQSTLFRLLRLRDVWINMIVPKRIMGRSRLLGQSRYVGLDPDREFEPEVVAGCFMLVPRGVYEKVGGFDRDFFMYGEDAEWCHRIRAGGFRVLYWPGAHVVHHGGQSARQQSARMAVALARSQLLLLQKTRGRGSAYAANWMMLVRDSLRALVLLIMQPLPFLRDRELAGLLRTTMPRFWFHLRGTLRTDWNES